MNISFSLAGLILIFSIMAFCKSNSYYYKFSNKIFSRILMCCVLLLVVDIYSILDCYHDMNSGSMLHIKELSILASDDVTWSNLFENIQMFMGRDLLFIIYRLNMYKLYVPLIIIMSSYIYEYLFVKKSAMPVEGHLLRWGVFLSAYILESPLPYTAVDLYKMSHGSFSTNGYDSVCIGNMIYNSIMQNRLSVMYLFILLVYLVAFIIRYNQIYANKSKFYPPNSVLGNMNLKNRIKYICFAVISAMIVLFVVSMSTFTVCITDSIGFIFTIIVLLLFYVFENPKEKIDGESNCFRPHFMKKCLDAMIGKSGDAHIGIIFSKNGQSDLSMLFDLLDNKQIACFKDVDSLCYLLTSDCASLVEVLNEYKNKHISVVAIYEHIDLSVLDTLLYYVKHNIAEWTSTALHPIKKEDIVSLEDENKMRIEIIDALLDNRIVTYVQPIYDIKTQKFISGECLCRLKCRNGDIIPPGKFIPIAERTGLIIDIETKMFRNICKSLAKKEFMESGIKYLEANLSIKKGEQKNLADEYSSILKEYNIPFDKINLEITETDIVEEKIFILNNMVKMREMGFNFSLDDFGTGESNLGYIIDMPVSIIKFDREITQKSMVDNKALTVVKNVINMVHELNIKVVIEGVETYNDLQVCKDIDADYIQGYYFSKPLPINEFVSFINKPIQVKV